MGATQKALARGVPVCVVPYGRDQFEVARRVAVAHAAPACLPEDCRPRGCVEGAGSDDHDDGAKRVAAGFAATGGVTRGADLFEQRGSASLQARPISLSADTGHGCDCERTDGRRAVDSAAVAAIPVIALTGYLGAGKTSLLNHVLRAPGARIGVVINDFGELNVDAALVTGQIDEPASITGGCICCLPDEGGLDDALERLTDPRLGLDAIIVEASGLADPSRSPG